MMQTTTTPKVEFNPVQTNQMQRSEKIRNRLWALVNSAFSLTPWFARMLRGKLCKLAGSKLQPSSAVARKARIDYPWRLTLGEQSSIADGAWAYCLANITIGKNCCIGEDVRLLTGTHSTNSPHFDLVIKPINIGDNVWIATGAIVLPGITIGEGAIVGAGSIVTHNIDPWTIVAGNPARPIRERILCN